ncbi:UNVERIFIED_CONTAM: hypothetical protein Slati_4179000 [Sesamum latifolium]|uniref:Uncharacterized protein n=1 Tax=Sesamum latifolium TaxID=2727402 RepID=A0AAW2TD00_9LAMI
MSYFQLGQMPLAIRVRQSRAILSIDIKQGAQDGMTVSAVMVKCPLAVVLKKWLDEGVFDLRCPVRAVE